MHPTWKTNMNKAQKILSQKACDSRKRRWAEGNAIAIEQDSKRNTTVNLCADGSTIKCVGAVLTVV
jgi:hypothetical protein